MKGNKQFAIIVLWTVIAIVIGLFLFLRRPRKSAAAAAVVSQRPVDRPASPQKDAKEGYFLVTLNELLFESDSMELLADNVSSIKRLCEEAGRRCKGLVVIFTVPAGMESDMSLRQTIETRLDEAGLISSGLKSHRILFTQTREGRISVGRQMEPILFLESDLHVVSELTGKIPNVVCLKPDELKSYIGPNFPITS